MFVPSSTVTDTIHTNSVCLFVHMCMCCSVSLHSLHVLRSICKPFSSLSPNPGLISASFMTELYLNATDFSIPLPGLCCSRCQTQTHHICYTKAIMATRGGDEILTHKQKLKECTVLTNAQNPTHTSHLCVHIEHQFITTSVLFFSFLHYSNLFSYVPAVEQNKLKVNRRKLRPP